MSSLETKECRGISSTDILNLHSVDIEPRDICVARPSLFFTSPQIQFRRGKINNVVFCCLVVFLLLMEELVMHSLYGYFTGTGAVYLTSKVFPARIVMILFSPGTDTTEVREREKEGQVNSVHLVL